MGIIELYVYKTVSLYSAYDSGKTHEELVLLVNKYKLKNQKVILDHISEYDFLWKPYFFYNTGGHGICCHIWKSTDENVFAIDRIMKCIFSLKHKAKYLTSSIW